MKSSYYLQKFPCMCASRDSTTIITYCSKLHSEISLDIEKEPPSWLHNGYYSIYIGDSSINKLRTKFKLSYVDLLKYNYFHCYYFRKINAKRDFTVCFLIKDIGVWK